LLEKGNSGQEKAMDLSAFLQQRRADWRRLEEILRRVEGSGLPSLDEAQAIEFGQLYRRAASDLNQAQTYVSGEATVRYLNDLVARCYLVIYARAESGFGRKMVNYFVFGFPAALRRHFLALLLATSLFLGGTSFGFLASYFDKAVARAYLLPEDFPTIEPSKEGDTPEREAMQKGQVAAFSAFLFRNNVSVTLIAFALGTTLGIGTAWMMFYNGVLTGALMAVFVDAEKFTEFATGILPHGVVEIPAMLIGGAAGFVLAKGMIAARPWPRAEEMARCGREALAVLGGILPLLTAAAIIEAGVARAPDTVISSGAKLAVAGVVFLVFAVHVLLFGWGKRLGTTAS
jgi:uncharacterized membrane protein SpoIIM required for sporulation